LANKYDVGSLSVYLYYKYRPAQRQKLTCFILLNK